MLWAFILLGLLTHISKQGHVSSDDLWEQAQKQYELKTVDTVKKGDFDEYVLVVAPPQTYWKSRFCRGIAGKPLCNTIINYGAYPDREENLLLYPYGVGGHIKYFYEINKFHDLNVWEIDNGTLCKSREANGKSGWKRHQSFMLQGKYATADATKLYDVEGAVKFCADYPNMPNFNVDILEVKKTGVSNKKQNMVSVLKDCFKGDNVCYEDFGTKEIKKNPGKQAYPIYNTNNMTVYAFCCEKSGCPGIYLDGNMARCIYTIHDELTGVDWYVPDNLEGFLKEGDRMLLFYPLINEKSAFLTRARKIHATTVAPPIDLPVDTVAPPMASDGKRKKREIYVQDLMSSTSSVSMASIIIFAFLTKLFA